MVVCEDFRDILGELFDVLILIIPRLFKKRVEIVIELYFQLLFRVNELTILILQSHNYVVPLMLYHCFVEKGRAHFPTFYPVWTRFLFPRVFFLNSSFVPYLL